METLKARRAVSIAVQGAGNCGLQVIATALPATEEEGSQDGNLPSHAWKEWPRLPTGEATRSLMLIKLNVVLMRVAPIGSYD